jgi:hypothetical protein
VTTMATRNVGSPISGSGRRMRPAKNRNQAGSTTASKASTALFTAMPTPVPARVGLTHHATPTTILTSHSTLKPRNTSL